MLTPPDILLVGSGQLGSRYLQGLVSSKTPYRIFVVDPQEESLAVSRQRLSQVPRASAHNIQFSTSLEAVPTGIDLALVATPSHCRSRVVAKISSHHYVKSWILEKLLSQSSSQLDQIVQALFDNSCVWVNTPRRLMGWHQDIKRNLLACGSSVLKVRLHGGHWGLACNTIHFIDLVCWWTGADVEAVDTRRLKDWHASKRSGFQEVYGSLFVKFSNGSTLELSCYQSDDPIQIEVETPAGIWLIDESVGHAVGPNGKKISGQIIFQSTLTSPLVEKILTSGRCGLPSLADSVAQHRPFLDALMNHWNHSHSREDLVVPIT